MLAGRTLDTETSVAALDNLSQVWIHQVQQRKSISVPPCFDLTYKDVVSTIIITEPMEGTRGSAPRSRDRTALLLFQGIPAWSEWAAHEQLYKFDGRCHRSLQAKPQSHLRSPYTPPISLRYRHETTGASAQSNLSTPHSPVSNSTTTHSQSQSRNIPTIDLVSDSISRIRQPLK